MFGVPVCHNGRTDKESNRLRSLSAVSLACAFTTQGLCCQQSLQALWFQNHAFKYLETIEELWLRWKEGTPHGKFTSICPWTFYFIITLVMIFYSWWWDCYVLKGIKTKIITKTMSNHVWLVMGSNFFIGLWLFVVTFITVTSSHSLWLGGLSVSVPYQARHLFCFLQSVQETINYTVLTQESTK